MANSTDACRHNKKRTASGRNQPLKSYPPLAPKPYPRRGSRRSYEKRGGHCGLWQGVFRFRWIESDDEVSGGCVDRCRMMWHRSHEAKIAISIAARRHRGFHRSHRHAQLPPNAAAIDTRISINRGDECGHSACVDPCQTALRRLREAANTEASGSSVFFRICIEATKDKSIAAEAPPKNTMASQDTRRFGCGKSALW